MYDIAYGNTEDDNFPDAPAFLKRPCITYTHRHNSVIELFIFA
jgi:hypothetical protein